MMKLVLEKNQKIFFTSDTHYGHSNICSATTNWKDADDLTRPFKTLEYMNDVLVNNINAMVGEDDILFHLGDWSFGGFDNIREFRERILCKNVHLILGNHDHHISHNKDDIKSLFSSVNEYLLLDLRVVISKNRNERYAFVLMHYPIASWMNMNQGVIHLHGHTHLPHNLKVAAGRAMDVGVDGNGLIPYSLKQILTLLYDRPIQKLSLPKDHHVKRVE